MSYRLKRFAELITVIVLIVPAMSLAQGAKPGDQVRVTTTSADSVRVGELGSLTDAGIVLRGPRIRQNGIPIERSSSSISMDMIRRLEVRRGRTKVGEYMAGGAILGTVGGAIAAGAFGYFITQCSHCEESGIGILLAVPGAGLGALFGTMAGLSKAPRRWETVPFRSSGSR